MLTIMHFRIVRDNTIPGRLHGDLHPVHVPIWLPVPVFGLVERTCTYSQKLNMRKLIYQLVSDVQYVRYTCLVVTEEAAKSDHRHQKQQRESQIQQFGDDEKHFFNQFNMINSTVQCFLTQDSEKVRLLCERQSLVLKTPFVTV